MGFGFHDDHQFDMERDMKRTLWTVLNTRRAALQEEMRSLDGQIARAEGFLEQFDGQWLAAASRRLASPLEARSSDPRVRDADDHAETSRPVFNQAVSLRCSEEELKLFDARTQALARHARGLDAGAPPRTDPRDIIALIKSKAAGNR